MKSTSMKSIVSAALNLAFAVVVVVGAYYAYEHFVPADPLGKDDRYKLDIETDAAAVSMAGREMTLTNNSAIDLRVHIFPADALIGDVRIVATFNDVLKRGASRSYSRAPYKINLWKSQLLDKHLKWTGELWTDVIFTGGEENLRVAGGPRPPVTITNTVDEQLKICVYNVNDTVRWVPLRPCWDLGKDRTVSWPDAPARFTAKVFRPAALDVALVTQSDVPFASALTIRKTGF